MFFSLPCLLLLSSLDLASGFQDRFILNRSPSAVGQSVPLLTNVEFASTPGSFRNTALFERKLYGMEGDPLEEDRRQRNHGPPKRIMPFQQTNPVSAAESQAQQQEPPKKRLVRPAKPPSNDNERKATTSTVAGVNMELKDPKKPKLVRHATASAAYDVDAFKGQKKKIIRPWSSGRKKHKNRQNNIGGLGREAYGEELKVELKNKPKEKRLVMARSAGNQDAAKSLISGGSLTAEDIAEEKRLREKRNRELAGEDVDDADEYYYDGVRYQNGNGQPYDTESDDDEKEDNEPRLVQPSSPTVEETEEDGERKLVRLTSSIVRDPDDEEGEKPNLVRLSESIVRQPEDEDSDEPNLVRLESSMVREPEKDPEEELTYYTRSETPVQEDEQRLVRAVRASKEPPSEEPKLVRPNIVKEKVEGPKLVKPNIVKAKVEGPKLVRPNVLRAKDTGPKLVRAPKTASGIGSSTAEDFMYGATASTSSPTGVPVDLKPKSFTKPAFTTGKAGTKIATAGPRAENSENFMYGSTKSSASPTSVPLNAKPKEYTRDISVTENNAMESLMYGAGQASTSPTAVSIEGSKLKRQTQSTDSTFDNPMDDLMYGANQATSSPVAIPIETKSKKFVRAAESASETSSSAGSVQGEGSQRPSSAPRNKDALSPNFKAMDDLMYGYQGSGSSPTAVEIKKKPTKYVRPESKENTSEASAQKSSTTLYPDGDKRKKVDEQRLVRASSIQTNASDSGAKRYVKPSASVMDRAVDWDAASPVGTTTNPASVTVSPKKKVVEKKEGKKYVQPTTSLMNNAPDWDAVAPATSTANPSVVNVDGKKFETPVKNTSENTSENASENASNPTETTEAPPTVEKEGKTYVQPSVSMMNKTPDWDAVAPAMSTANPSQVYVSAPQQTSKAKDDSTAKAEAPKSKKKYVQPSVSMMDKTKDWDAVQPAISTANPSVVNIDGINNNGKEKRFVRSKSASSSSSPEAKQTSQAAPADTPFEYKQIQSIPNENPANAKPADEGEEKTKLPAEIAHAAGSSSDGWTPQAHFPSDKSGDKSGDNKTTMRPVKRSTMENYDPDALPRPTGVIPLTVSSSAKEKTQLFRAEDALEPVEDDDLVGDDDDGDDDLNGGGTGSRLEEKTVSPFTRNVDVSKKKKKKKKKKK